MPDPLTGTPELEQLQFDLDVATTAYDAAASSLAKALGAAEANLKTNGYIEDTVQGVHDAQALAQDALAKIAVARGAAKKAAYHPASVKAAGKAVVGAIKQIATMEKTLLKADTAGDRMLDRLATKDNAQMDRELDYEKGVRQLAKDVAALEADRASLLEALQSLYANAAKAALKGNAGSLELARDDLKGLAWLKWTQACADAQLRMDGLLEQQGGVNHESLQAVAPLLRKARLQLGGQQKDRQTMQDLARAVAAMKPKALDVGKIARKLGVPAKLQELLAKAMAKPEDQQPKAFDALVEAAGLKTTGKAIAQMLASGKLGV